MNLSSSWIGMDASKYPCFQKSKVSVFDHSVTPQPGMAVFRKTFEMQTVPDDLTAFFSGDCKFRLFINGIFVEDGPVEVGGDYGNAIAPNWWFYDSKNIATYCKSGINIIVAEVLNIPDAQTDYSIGITGFTFEMLSGNKTILISDHSWKTFRNPAFRETCNFDASLFSGNYHIPEFDDSQWDNAVKIPGKWNLKKLNLPSLKEEIVRPVECVIPFAESKRQIKNQDALLFDNQDFATIEPGLPCHFYLRFADEIAGHVEIDVESDGGAVIELEYQEVPGVTAARDKYTTAMGRRKFRFTRMQPVLWIKVNVSCGAFPAISYAPVKIYSILVNKRSFPLPETTMFRCSDEGLMKVRDTIDRTMRLCMMRLHLDSPVHQEGLGCTGDYMIESLISYSLYGETRLAAADILRTAYLLEQKNGFMFHTSYSLLYIDMVRDYYMRTADNELLTQVFPAVQLVLERFAGYIGKTGLISNAPNYMFIDWINDSNINYHHPPAERGMGCLTAFYYHALLTAVELAKYLKISTDYMEKAEQVKRSFTESLWDAERCCFKDGIPHLGTDGVAPWCPPDCGEIAYSVHTNALALAFGLVSETDIMPLADKIMTDSALLQPQPYFMHFVFEALHKTGTFGKYGFSLMKRWETLADEHPAGLKECWNCGDYSHAWGGSPAYQLVRSVLGIEPLEPGFKKVRIAPEFGELSFAEGEVPTVLGTIRVKYDGSHVKISLPSGMELVD